MYCGPGAKGCEYLGGAGFSFTITFEGPQPDIIIATKINALNKEINFFILKNLFL